MTKEDILQMKTSLEIGRALTSHKDLWCKETSDHLRDVARKEKNERYGTTDFVFDDPFRRKK